MSTINIKQLVGTIVIIPTPEGLNQDLTNKIVSELLNAIALASNEIPDNNRSSAYATTPLNNQT